MIKRMRIEKPKSSVFKRIFITYMLMLVIPFLVILEFTARMLSVIRENNKNETEYIVEKTLKEFNYRIIFT